MGEYSRKSNQFKCTVPGQLAVWWSLVSLYILWCHHCLHFFFFPFLLYLIYFHTRQGLVVLSWSTSPTEHLLEAPVLKCRRTGSGSSNTPTRQRTWQAAMRSYQGSHASLLTSTSLGSVSLPEDSLEFPEFVLVSKGRAWVLAGKTHSL